MPSATGGVVGLLINKENAQSEVSALKEAAQDESGAVVTLAAETLYELGQESLAWEAYIRILTDSDNFGMTDRNFALNSIDAIDGQSPEIIAVVQELFEGITSAEDVQRYRDYDILMSEYLLKKWGVIVN